MGLLSTHNVVGHSVLVNPSPLQVWSVDSNHAAPGHMGQQPLLPIDHMTWQLELYLGNTYVASGIYNTATS